MIVMYNAFSVVQKLNSYVFFGNRPNFIAVDYLLSHLTEIFKYIVGMSDILLGFNAQFLFIDLILWHNQSSLNYIIAMLKNQMIYCRNYCYIHNHGSPTFCFTLTLLTLSLLIFDSYIPIFKFRIMNCYLRWTIILEPDMSVQIEVEMQSCQCMSMISVTTNG